MATQGVGAGPTRQLGQTRCPPSHLPAAVTGCTELDIFLFSAVHSQANLGCLLLRVHLEFQPGQVVEEFGEVTLHLPKGWCK